MATTVDKKPAQDIDRKIAGRIMAMLARAEDEAATENEARIAKEKAKKLMSKHSLSRADLENLDFEYREVMLRFSQQPGWQQEIVAGLKKLLGVFAIYCTGSGRDRKAKYKLTGRASDLDQFEYLLNSITTQVYELCDDWKKDHHNRRQTRDFRMGVAMRVRDRLYDLVTSITERQKEEAEAVAQGSSETFDENETRNEEETGMVFLKEEEVRAKQEKAENLMGDHASWSSGSATTYRRSASAAAGRSAGDEVRFSDGVGSSERTKRLPSNS